MKSPVVGKDIWHPGEKRYIKKDGRLTEFGLEFFSKYDSKIKDETKCTNPKPKEKNSTQC